MTASATHLTELRHNCIRSPFRYHQRRERHKSAILSLRQFPLSSVQLIMHAAHRRLAETMRSRKMIREIRIVALPQRGCCVWKRQGGGCQRWCVGAGGMQCTAGQLLLRQTPNSTTVSDDPGQVRLPCSEELHGGWADLSEGTLAGLTFDIMNLTLFS